MLPVRRTAYNMPITRPPLAKYRSMSGPVPANLRGRVLRAQARDVRTERVMRSASRDIRGIARGTTLHMPHTMQTGLASRAGAAIALHAPPAEGKMAATFGKRAAEFVRTAKGRKVALGAAGAAVLYGAMSNRSGRGVNRSTTRPTGMYGY